MKKMILFDLNGTLVDDNEIWKASMEEVFKAFRKTPPTVAEYYSELEGDWAKVYTSRGIEASADELNAIYIPYFTSRIHESKLFTGVTFMLQSLKEEGHNIGLISAQPEKLIIPVLEELHLTDYLEKEFISMHNRNKHETIEEFVIKAGMKKENCFYVGDAPSDIKHGNKAGVKTIAFLNGFVPEDLVFAKNPTFVIREMNNLLYFV